MTDVIEAGVEAVAVGPAPLEIADVEIVTPCSSVLILLVQRSLSFLAKMMQKVRGGIIMKKETKRLTTAAHRCCENNCPISTSSGAHPSQHAYHQRLLRYSPFSSRQYE